MEKLKKINYVGIITALIFVTLIFVPFVAIAGIDVKIYGGNLIPLANIGAIPYELMPIFEMILKYAMYVFIGIAVALVVFSIFPIGFFNVLFIVAGIISSIIFVLIDVIGGILYFGSSQLMMGITDKFSIGVGVFLLTLGSIMLLASGIVGLSKSKNKEQMV